jgi:DNA-binding response OmpR family regulator
MSERSIESAGAPGPVRARSERPPPGAETILIVEDDPAVLRATSRILLHAGYTVVVARTFEEALLHAGAASDPLHLILSDLMLPGADAGEVAHQLVDQRPGLPVLFVTGQAPEDVLLSHPQLPARTVRQKPVSPTLLLATIRQLLDRVRSGRSALPDPDRVTATPTFLPRPW